MICVDEFLIPRTGPKSMDRYMAGTRALGVGLAERMIPTRMSWLGGPGEERRRETVRALEGEERRREERRREGVDLGWLEGRPL